MSTLVSTAHDPARFRRGDHLRVRRPLGYDHHGIYVSDDRVIQFGGRIADKPRAAIEAVTLAEFECDGEAQVVVHDRQQARSPFWLPVADSPDRIIERAEWLLGNQPPRGRYNLIGNNCEHAANFCVAEFTESLQVRRFFLVKWYAGFLVALYVARAERASRSIPRRAILVAMVGSFLVTASYHFHIRRFWRDVGARWRDHDRLRPGQPPGE